MFVGARGGRVGNMDNSLMHLMLRLHTTLESSIVLMSLIVKSVSEVLVYSVAIHSPTVLTSCAKSGHTTSVAACFCSCVKEAVVSLSMVTW